MSGRDRAQARYEHTGFFVLRTPLLPFEALEAWGKGLTAPKALGDDATLADALAHDTRLLTQRLREQVQRADVREALFCASPSLDAALDAWLDDPASSRARGVTSILVRYFTRMSARPTPFGLFSGSSVGTIGESTHLELGAHAAYTRHSRLDMAYLSRLVERLEREPSLRERLRYTPSSGLYRLGGQLRHAEARIDPKTGVRSYHLVSFGGGDAIETALSRAQGGARPAEMAAALVESDPEVSMDEARAFVDALIDNQLLVSELSPPLTGPEPIHAVLSALDRVDARDVAAPLESARNALQVMDERELGRDAEGYRAIAATLSALPVEVDLAKLFQVDLHKPAPSAVLGAEPMAELYRGVELTARISPARPDKLAFFREAFTRRFEDREVPLLQALDEDRGVGFASAGREPSPLLDGLALPARGDTPMRELAQADAWIARRLSELLSRGEREWQLDDRDVSVLTRDAAQPFPDSFAIYAFFAARSSEALDRGDFRVRIGVWGPTAAVMLARFCHGDPALHLHMQKHLRAEESLQPDAVFAEVVHLSEGRMGNVMCRPVLRGHEIPYLGRSGALTDRQIPIEDLRVSVRRGRVVLRSSALDREVVPRMSTAFIAARSSLALYGFFAALQEQGVTHGFGWSWGAAANAARLPRVSRGRQVLALAQWTLDERDISAISVPRGVDRFRAVQALRERLGLPRWVTLSDYDRVLAVDLDNVLSVENLLGMAKNRKTLILEEMFPAPDELCVRGPEGRYVHEMLVPVVARREPSPAAPRPIRPSAARSFPPGTSWLFAKLYAGLGDVDGILLDVVAPLVRRAIGAGAADSWFFLRYSDPDWHLRVRVHGAPEALLSHVLPALRDAISPLVADGSVHRFTLDTYERETERYGGDRGIELAEALFHADSDAAARALSAFIGDDRADARWRLALLGMDRLLDDLGLDLPARTSVVANLRDGFGKEQRVDVGFERQLGAKYRQQRLSLEALLAATPSDSDHPLHQGFAAFAERSEQLRPVVAALYAAEAAGELGHAVSELAGSYLHMHANRMLGSEHRTQELVLYDWLLRLYQSAGGAAAQTDLTTTVPRPDLTPSSRRDLQQQY